MITVSYVAINCLTIKTYSCVNPAVILMTGWNRHYCSNSSHSI